jgi:soluble P-type ATPase
VRVDLPGNRGLVVRHLVLDFNGTLAFDGVLLPGVASRLRRLAKQLEVAVLTADTFGTAAHEFRPFPVTLKAIRTGRDKQLFVRGKGRRNVAALGNGRNDRSMLAEAALSVAVIGPEGAAAEVLRGADIVSRSITEALDLFLFPRRLTATLRL